YPIYDGHGNMIATLGQTQGSPYYSLADLRSYDVWGAVRSGSTTGNPRQRYCANLGHVQDDESGLIYMRARYYEPWSGRFLSEDSLKAGFNWYIYAQSNPIRFVDVSGQEPLPEDVQGWFEWILKKYGDYTDGMSDPRIKILAAGASACTSLTSIAARVDTASNIMTAAGLTSTWIATSMPWLGALLLSLGAVGRIAAGGMRIAAALLALATILAVLTTDVE
ncbi:MAG: RHS repeat-associated core domain-containing protein, partial [Armatimonadetes bacterium]|nr:RHS repeat-associated core domain-containing protein [Armatimonadota bacterium]NOG39944.1 RHS repeat-associated core domain-containing protein [Armatimonadota bacterium]